MNICVESHVSHKHALLFTSLLSAMLLTSLYACLLVSGSAGTSLTDAVHVKNEDELKNAINNALTGKPTTIALDNDITLTTFEDVGHIYTTIILLH